MIIDGDFFPFFWQHGQRIALRTTSYYSEPLASVYEGAGLAFPVSLIIRLCKSQFTIMALRSLSGTPLLLIRAS